VRLIEKLKMLIALLGITTSDEEIDLEDITNDDVISQLVSGIAAVLTQALRRCLLTNGTHIWPEIY